MAMDRKRRFRRNTTTRRTGDAFTRLSRRVSGSTKRSKPAQRRVFGRSSQFAGVRVGRPGDPRR